MSDLARILDKGNEVALKAAERVLDERRSRAAANDNSVPLISDRSLDDLTRPGGLVESLVDWIVSSAERPSRPLALSAVIPFLGALVGRRFASPTDLRTNFYMAALAGSGYGKEHARTQIKRLITAAGLHSFAAPSRFMSASALRGAVMAQPASVSMVDEFGGMIRQITDKRASIHNQLIRGDLLELWSSGATYFDGAEYAGTKAEKIFNPCFSLYGTSTPDDFWSALSSMSAADGLLARFLLFNVEGAKPSPVTPERGSNDVPADIVQAVQNLAMAGRPKGNLSTPSLDSGSISYPARAVAMSTEASQLLADFKSRIEAHETTVDRAALPFLNRAAEHAIKLALLVAVASDFTKPEITGSQMAWAIDLAWCSTCALASEADARISDNQREANYKRILNHIRKAGAEGISEGVLTDRTKSISMKDRTEILADLELSGRIAMEVLAQKRGRPKRRYFLR